MASELEPVALVLIAKLNELKDQRAKIEECKADIMERFVDPLTEKLISLDVDLAILEKEMDKFRYVLIESKNFISESDLRTVIGTVGDIATVKLDQGNECYLALVEFKLPIQIDKIKGVDGIVMLSSPNDFKTKREPKRPCNYIIWKYGKDKYNKVITKLNLIPKERPYNPNYLGYLTTSNEYCCICGKVANNWKCNYYYFNENYVVCSRSPDKDNVGKCLKKLMRTFGAYGIKIPIDKFLNSVQVNRS
jgi:hypothetical protein